MDSHPFSNLGGKDKPVDENDVIIGASTVVKYIHPKELKNAVAWGAPVEYQGDEPACGAHSGSKVLGLAKGRRFSPRAQWADLKSFDGWAIDDGTDIRSIFKSITKNLGGVDYDVYGNDVSLPSKEYAKVLTKQMRALGVKYTGDGYGFAGADRSFDALKDFITANGPTVVLARVGNEWWTDKKGRSSWKESDICPVRVPNPVTSGHFFVAHSFDDGLIYFINSFGETWGRKGHGYFGPEYMPFINDWGALFPLSFTKDLYDGVDDPQVKELQKYLNRKGFTVAVSGAGSPGNETTYFGSRTKLAVMGFQARNGIKPVSGYFGPLTRAVVAVNP